MVRCFFICLFLLRQRVGRLLLRPCNSAWCDSRKLRVAVAGGSPTRPGSLKAVGEHGAPPVIPLNRTVAGAAKREARLGKDGSPWTASPLVSTFRRTASTSPCVRVEKCLRSSVIQPDWNN